MMRLVDRYKALYIISVYHDELLLQHRWLIIIIVFEWGVL